MTTNVYTYSLLQYRHSQILEEVLNIGLLIYFPSQKRLEFIYPEKLVRLRFAYPDVPDKTIKAYYRSFENRVQELNKNPEVFADVKLRESFENFIESEFLPKDSSALQFGPLKKGIYYGDQLKNVVDQLYNLYFIVFEHDENISRRLDETHLLKKYKKLIQEFDKDLLQNSKKIQFDYTLDINDGKHFKFQIAWEKNNRLNLVKPISFDVKRQETLQSKAYRYYGQFLDLQEIADQKNYRFDLLLAKPKEKNLFKHYDNAVKLLEKPKHVKLIEETELKEYSAKTAHAIS